MLSVDSSNQQAMMRSKLCPRHLFLQTHKRAFVPANTQKNTGWAHKVFLDWCAVRNKLLTNNALWICSIKLMLVNWTTSSHASLSRWEGRMDSHIPQNHLPDTCWLKANDDRQKPGAPKFLDREKYCFRKLMYTCNPVYRDLHSQGIGTDVRHTPTFSSDNEKLWETGVLGDSTPKSSQQAVFFLCCKNFLYPWWRGAKKAGPFSVSMVRTPRLLHLCWKWL